MRPVLNQMAAAGRLSSKAAYEHPRRRSLRSALTGKEIRLIDRSPEPLPLAPGDALILASDGLETLGRREIGRILKRASHLGPATIVTRLLDAVRNARNPHQDNVTIIAYRVTQEADARRAGRKAGMGRFLPWLMLAGVLIAAALFGLHVVPF